jgi:predicted HTH transcriptional regulator
MTTLNQLLVAEAAEYEFKSALETNKPRSWLKTVSAFANGVGLIFLTTALRLFRRAECLTARGLKT